MPEGVIIGGWNYVIAAYGILIGTLVIYSIMLFRRFRSTAKKDSVES